MARVLTNNVSLRYAIESSVGVLPGSPKWRTLEPNGISSFGGQLTKVARRPISPIRGRRKGTVTDKDSPLEWEADQTMDALTDFAEGFVFSEFANVEFDLKASTGTVPPPVATSATWTVDSISATLAGKLQFVALGPWPLVFSKGYTNAANNGLHQLTVDPAAAAVTLTTDSVLVVETPSTKASLQVAGVRCAIGDLALVVSGSTATITSAADIADWATLGLRAGQWLHVGSDDGSGGRQHHFDDGASGDVYGYARISSIAGAVLNLDKIDAKLTTSDASNATLVDIMFGRFLRNVRVDADSTDNRYLERTYQVEATYPDLGGVGTDEYEYAIGNYANQLQLNWPLAEKATATWGFVGTNTEDITTSRKTGASSAVDPLRTTALNTSSDFASLTTDVIASVSDVCFKSLTLTIKNNMSPEKCLGTLGASNVNSGAFEVTLEGQMMFTNKAIVNAVRNNTTVTFAAILKNDDGAYVVDLPALTFGDGSREFPVDASVLVNITGETFTDPTLGFDVGLSFFPSVPTDRS